MWGVYWLALFIYFNEQKKNRHNPTLGCGVIYDSQIVRNTAKNCQVFYFFRFHNSVSFEIRWSRRFFAALAGSHTMRLGCLLSVYTETTRSQGHLITLATRPTDSAFYLSIH